MQQALTDKRPLVLYIEDEPDLREDVAEELEESGLQVVQASDGEQAMVLLDSVRPDLILCDITMPGMSGYELLQALRQTRPQLADIPFVFLTAQTDPRQVIEGKQAGADDYLIKPVDFDLMLATIHARLTQIARIREHHGAEVRNIQNALRDLHAQRRRHTIEHITRAFDYVGFGIVLLASDTTVKFANCASRRMAESVSGMTLDGVFRLGGIRQMDAFRMAFTTITKANNASTDAVECLAVSRTDGQRDLLFMVCPLVSEHSLETDDPIVMLIMADPSHRRPAAAGVLESLFGLTPTEAQVANAFADGKRTDEIAARFNISTTTVNFHKRNLFEKTGTNRQADLIALLLSLPVSEVS